MSFLGQVNFNLLSEVDRSIYNYMTTNSDKIPYMRVREIADESHTSASSVMRFIRKIGYESFTDFKTHFRIEHEMSFQGNYFEKGESWLAAKNFPQNTELQLKIIAEKILKADTVILFGTGSSGAICEYGGRKLASIGCNSVVLTDPTYPIFGKLRNTASNLLITLSVSGTTTEVIETVNGFNRHPDFETVCITANSNSTLAAMSDYILSYQVEIQELHKHEDMTSQIPCMHLLESLVMTVLELDNVL
ncbi:MurR/RpiR family transcriptional regulator [Vagococcus salmoninarum]|uniref:RpiR family transcriptional regulator n=1 Tax=Vagococcus salmoninarum TaxID=2739 RepID=A0A429ZQM8_9ENTE|nr:MurR/RpiR family transcriptional regulator [Vagococcus salmoninarum]RST96030.1 RpiR family transcriptional regulator [Vagococcus salmoninarum]